MLSTTNTKYFIQHFIPGYSTRGNNLQYDCNGHYEKQFEETVWINYCQTNSMSIMKRIIYLVFVFLAFGSNFLLAQENSVIEVSGIVTDQEHKLPLQDVSVQVKGTVTGAITNASGKFVLRTKSKFPFILVFSSIGFQQQEFEVKSLGSNLQIELVTQTVLGSEVVVSASVDTLAYSDIKDKTQIGVEIHSGRNRIVRRIFEHLGYDVRGLDRVSFAGLTKKNIERGKWRFLSEKEVRDLKHFGKGR